MIPKGGRKITKIDELRVSCEERSLIHIATARRNGKYFHHYIIIGMESDWSISAGIKIVHYSGPYAPDLKEKNIGKVTITDITVYDLEEDIKNGLYEIHEENYPKSNEEIQSACNRYKEREGEQMYDAVNNNCEHLARYIMTGLPFCEQVENRMFLAMQINFFVKNGMKNVIKTILECLSYIFSNPFCRAVATKVTKHVVENHHMPIECSIESAKCFTKNVLGYVCKTSSNSLQLDQLLSCNTCQAIAEFAGKSAVWKTIGVSALCTVVVECIYLYYTRKKLLRLLRVGKISEKYFTREMNESWATFIGALAGTALGTYLGLHVSFSPAGAFAGGLIGNFLFRWLFSMLGGLLYKADELAASMSTILCPLLANVKNGFGLGHSGGLILN